MDCCHKCNCRKPCCPRCHCCSCCCCCCPVPLLHFTVVKRNRITNLPLAGAIYTLYQNNLPVITAISDICGALRFTDLTPGQYELIECVAPTGYHSDTVPHNVVVNANDSITIDGQNAEGSSLYDDPLPVLSFSKTNAITSLPVAGATFTLSNGSTAISNSDGLVNFGPLSSGAYTMRETAAPIGYLPNPAIYQVTVGNEITVNGRPLSDFTVENVPQATLSFNKYDADTRQPLANATFTLSNGNTATSGNNGLVQFGVLTAGAYTMRETTVPDGYQPNTATYAVNVAANGVITVDDLPLAEFSVYNVPVRSPQPVINSVAAGDNFITGTGVPGASLTAILPDSTRITTTVGDNNIWIIPVPDGITLQAGQIVSANQTATGSSPSENASVTVHA